MRRRNMAEILPKMRKIPFDQLITFQKRNESNQFEYVTSVNLDKFHWKAPIVSCAKVYGYVYVNDRRYDLL